MKRGISVTRDYDYHNTPCVVITKKRGKLTIPEITDILHYEDQQRWSGRYALLLDCTEVTMGGNGCLDMMDERPGDAVAEQLFVLDKAYIKYKSQNYITFTYGSASFLQRLSLKKTLMESVAVMLGSAWLLHERKRRKARHRR